MKILLFLLSFLISNCSTFQYLLYSNKEKEAQKIIKNAFIQLSKPDSSNDLYFVGEISQQLKKFPNLKDDYELINTAKKLFQFPPNNINCTYQIEEPSEEGYSLTGFKSPFYIVTQCENSNKLNIPFKIFSLKSVRFGEEKQKKYLKEIYLTTQEANKQKFFISALSTSKDNNKIEITKSNRYTKQIQKEIKKFGITIKMPDIQFSPSKYQILNAPIYDLQLYRSRAESMGPNFDSSYQMIHSGNLSAAVLGNGIFTIGMKFNNNEYDLIYGHPNSMYADGPWSSYTTIRVNKKDYRFSDLENLKTKINANATEAVTIGKIPGKDLFILQKIKAYGKDNFRLYYEVKNFGNKGYSVGLRVLLDTWAGTNDGVPFTIPGAFEESKTIFSKEMKFTPSSSPIWETYDEEGKGLIFLRNTMVGDGLVPPDEIAFTSWSSSHGTDWQYNIDSNNYVTGDSAVVQWWYPVLIPAKKRYVIATDYGYARKKSKLYFELLDPVKGTGLLHIAIKNPDIKEMQLIYKITVNEGKYIIDKKKGKKEIKFLIQPGERLQRSIPMTIIGSGQVFLTVEEFKSGKMKKYQLPINLEAFNRGYSPGVWSINKYPIVYLSHESGLKLQGVVKSGLKNIVLGSCNLQEKRIKKEKYLYQCTVNLGKYQGNIKIEIKSNKKKKNYTGLPFHPSKSELNTTNEKFKILGTIKQIDESNYELVLRFNENRTFRS